MCIVISDVMLYTKILHHLNKPMRNARSNGARWDSKRGQTQGGGWFLVPNFPHWCLARLVSFVHCAIASLAIDNKLSKLDKAVLAIWNERQLLILFPWSSIEAVFIVEGWSYCPMHETMGAFSSKNFLEKVTVAIFNRRLRGLNMI